MTIDKAKLKALAETATQGEWSHERFGVIHAGPVIQFANGEGRLQIAMATGADWMVQGEQIANAEFMAAANPAVVLALLAEIEDLHAQHARDSGELRKLCSARDSARRQRDQLKAENEALRKDAERYRGVRRVANRQGFTDQQFDQQTDTRIAKFDAAMAKAASHD